MGVGGRTIVRVKWIETQEEVKFLLEVTKICSRTPCHIWALKFITVSKTAHHPQAYYWSLSTAESSDYEVETIADRLKAGRMCFVTQHQCSDSRQATPFYMRKRQIYKIIVSQIRKDSFSPVHLSLLQVRPNRQILKLHLYQFGSDTFTIPFAKPGPWPSRLLGPKIRF